MNFLYEFNTEELKQFSIYISNLDSAYWEEYHRDCNLLRKIPIATFQANLVLMINSCELDELKQLLFFKTETSVKLLSTGEINYSSSLN